MLSEESNSLYCTSESGLKLSKKNAMLRGTAGINLSEPGMSKFGQGRGGSVKVI